MNAYFSPNISKSMVLVVFLLFSSKKGQLICYLEKKTCSQDVPKSQRWPYTSFCLDQRRNPPHFKHISQN